MITADLDLEFRVHVNADDDESPEHVAQRLSVMTPAWKKEAHGGVSAPYSWATWVQLRETFRDRLQANQRLRDVAERDDHGRTRAMDGLAGLKGQHLWGWDRPEHKPFPHQETAARMIAAYQKVLLCDDPGTGKTASAILGLRAAECQDAGTTLPVIVVCPASVVDQWLGECRAWAPDSWRAVAWRGPKRHSLVGRADVYVMSYNTFGRDAKAGKLDALAPQALVLDEAHAITNRNTSQSKLARALAKRLDTVILLTGTPVRNDASDLWALLNALDGPVYPAFHRWRDRYCDTLVLPYATLVTGFREERREELLEGLRGQYRQARKEDLKDLPPKIRSIRTTELPADWARTYREYEKDMTAITPDGDLLSTMEPLEIITRLVQLSNSACDVEQEIVQTEAGPRVRAVVTPRAPFWKLPLLREVLEERPTEQVLVFAPFRSSVQAAWEDFAKWSKDQASLVIGGQNADVRTKHVTRFQAGDHRALFATTGAGGVGLTLTAASTVVFLQRPWSLVDSSQAEDRAHRIGSEVHHRIDVVDLVTKGTMDEAVIKALKSKKYQADGFSTTPRGLLALLGLTKG